jgi:hypothetical protein
MGRSDKLRLLCLVLGASLQQGGTRVRAWWTQHGGEEPHLLLWAVKLLPQDGVIEDIGPWQLCRVW